MTDAEKIKQVRQILLKCNDHWLTVDGAIAELKALGLVIKSDDQDTQKYRFTWWSFAHSRTLSEYRLSEPDMAGFARIIELRK